MTYAASNVSLQEKELSAFEQSAIKKTPLGIVIVNAVEQEMPIVYCNRAFEQLTGYRAQEVVGRNCRFLQGEDRDQPGVAELRQALLAKREASVVVRNYRKNGELFWCEINIAPIPDEQGKIKHFIGVQNDITARMIAQKQLERTTRALNDAQRIACLGSWSSAGVIGTTEWSPEMFRLYNRDPQLGVPQTVDEFVELVHREDRGAVRERHLRIWKQTGQIENLDVRTNPEFGPLRWLDSSVTRVADADTEHGFHAAGTVIDVTDRKLAEFALRESESRFRTLCQHAVMGIFLADVTGNCIYVNDASCQITGVSASRSLGNGWFSTLHPSDRDRIGEQWNGTVKMGRGLDDECRFVHADGTTVWAHVRVGVHRDDNDERIGFVGSLMDVTRAKLAQAELEESERRYRTLAEHAPEAIMMLDAETCRFIDFNQNALDLFKTDAKTLRHLGPEDFCPPFQPDGRPSQAAARQHIDATLAGEHPVFEWLHRDSTGRDVLCEVRLIRLDVGDRTLVRGSVMDISARKQTEERLRERESQLAHYSRLSTMGEMVAGIAHELNQPLYSIVNYSKAMSNLIKNPSEQNISQVAQWNEQISKSAERAGQIIRRLRGFVQRESTYVSTDLHEAIRDALELVRHESDRAGITLTADLTASSAMVCVDRVQTQQVLVNLLVNAIEAIGQNDSPIREIHVTCVHQGNTMEVAVADTGPGWSWDDERLMFAAFETTKPGGMGMGLAISNTIIETFGGRLWATRNERGGATFRFSLPLEASRGKQEGSNV